MKNLLSIFLIISITSCSNTNKDGVWYVAYYIKIDGTQNIIYNNLLLDIEGDSCSTITFGDWSTGDYEKILDEKHYYNRSSDILHFDYRDYKTDYSGDSLILTPTDVIDSLGIFQQIVLRKIDSKYKNIKYSKHDFNGAYVISGGSYVDSLNFINDSGLSFVGEFSENYPLAKWKIINYKDFSFFYLLDQNFPITILKHCSSDSIVMEYPFKENFELSLEPINKVIVDKKLLGAWYEVKDTHFTPPHPKQLNFEDLFLKLQFSKDSVMINYLAKAEKLKWYSTNEGKRIYFDFTRWVYDTESWKILKLTDNELVMYIPKRHNTLEKIVYFKRK